MTSPIRLRPHHLLCSLGFENKGYSDAFIANMAAIVSGRLRAPSGEGELVEITTQADDICTPCPKRRGSGCAAGRKIGRLDSAHATALGLADGDQLSWGDAQARIRARVRPGDLQRICKGCSWLAHGMCEAALARLHDAAATGQSPLDPEAPE